MLKMTLMTFVMMMTKEMMTTMEMRAMMGTRKKAKMIEKMAQTNEGNHVLVIVMQWHFHGSHFCTIGWDFRRRL